MNRTINNVLKYAICTLVYLSVFVPLVVAPTLYFPFVTGKAHAFRLLVELATALYLILVMRDRSYLPKKNLLLWSVIGFTAILGVATIFAESPYRAFWSNFERMEGYIMILHLFAFFIVSSSVLRGKKMWWYLMNTSLAVSIIMGIEGFGDLKNGIQRIAGPLGNSSYLGVYALLHMFIAGLLLAGVLKVKKFREAVWLSLTYVVVILFNAAVLYQTGTRGSFAGLIVGILLIALLLAILDKGIKRKVGITLLSLMVFIVLFLGIFQNASFIKNNDLLYRFSSLITFNVSGVLHDQGGDRLLLWGVALKGVEARPILGWGQDNFGYVFAKYYNPAMWNQEQWFDRTHDVFLDWLISGGILGLLSYLSLFYAVLYLVWKKPKTSATQAHAQEWDVTEKAIFTGLLAAYFVHNLFVFDNLSSYIIFFILLAYVAERYNAMKYAGTSLAADSMSSESKPLVSSVAIQSVAALVIVVACLACVYYVVYKPYMAGATVIDAIQPTLVDSATKANLSDEQAAEYRLAEFQKALGYNTFGNTEIREQLTTAADGVFSQLVSSSGIIPDVVKNFDVLTAAQYKLQLAQTPNDPRPYIFYGVYLQKIGAYDEALTYIDKAVSLSPLKQSFLFQEGTTEIAAGQYDKAIATLKNAYQIEPANGEAQTLYALAYIYAGQFDQAKAVMAGNLAIETDSRVLQAYVAMNRYADIITIIQAEIASSPTNDQLYMSLAGAYLKLHQGTNAVTAIKAAIAIAPQFAQLGNYYIKEIQAGRDPSAEPAPTQAQIDAANK